MYLTDDEKLGACFALHELLLWDKVDLSGAKVELSQKQKYFLLRAVWNAIPAEAAKFRLPDGGTEKISTMIRQLALIRAWHIQRAKHKVSDLNQSFSAIDKAVAKHYQKQGCKLSARRVEEARLLLGPQFQSAQSVYGYPTDKSLAALDLPHIDLNKTIDLM